MGLRTWERTSFENMVWFYREELQKIWAGIRAPQILTLGERRRLKHLGILKEDYRPCLTLILSDIALSTLRDLSRSSLAIAQDPPLLPEGS